MAQKTFGKYAIIDPVKYQFKQEPDWYWMIKPPTPADELVVSRVLMTDRSRTGPDGTREVLLTSTLEVALREIAVTFAGTNIPTSESDPTPILPKNATWEQVEALLLEMPREMVSELWIAVGDAVPGWGPAKQAKPAKSEETSEEKPDDEAKN